MIIGLIPVGGPGSRLGLPFSKEMIPQKHYDHYNPVVNHLVTKMELSGARKFVFVHGLELKQAVVDFYPKATHIQQSKLGFANVLADFIQNAGAKADDVVLFGLPDSVFNGNPFIEMLDEKGIVAGLFTTEPFAKVDRLSRGRFQVKSIKTADNEDWFWGVLKFDMADLLRMDEADIFSKFSEIGEILNYYGFKTARGDRYLDLGTWAGYNRYLTSDEMYSNIEIEKKYDASGVTVAEFNGLFSSECKHITSTDYYFSNGSDAIEFIRYREDSSDDGAVPDLTVKNQMANTTNRFELTLPLAKSASTHNVLHMMRLLGCKREFKVTKECWIYELDGHVIVYYTFNVGSSVFRIIEVELTRADFNLLSSAEERLSMLAGFDPTKVILKSKYQMIREALGA